MFGGAVYLAWMPLQEGFIGFLSALSERVLRLVDRPPLITSLTPRGNVIFIHSFLTGLQDAMASWNGENLHIYVVASLTLVLAVPLRSWVQRSSLIGLTVVVIFFVSLSICVVQLKTVAGTFAANYMGITLHTPGEKTLLEWANRGLIMLGMLLFPSFLFLISYLSLWSEDTKGVPEGTTTKGSEGKRKFSSWKIWTAVPATLAGMAAGWVLLAATPPEPDPRRYHEGWKKILRLNPTYAPAHVNVGLHQEEQGRLEEAIESYQEALRNDPELVEAHFNLGNAFLKQGHYLHAAGRYEEVLTRDPNHGPAHKNLGVALLRLDRPCEALPHLETSTRLGAQFFADPVLRDEISRLETVCNGD